MPGQPKFWWAAPWPGLARPLICSHSGVAPAMLVFRSSVSGLLGSWTLPGSSQHPQAHTCHFVPGRG